jgi:hypothetical protein
MILEENRRRPALCDGESFTVVPRWDVSNRGDIRESSSGNIRRLAGRPRQIRSSPLETYRSARSSDLPATLDPSLSQPPP